MHSLMEIAAEINIPEKSFSGIYPHVSFENEAILDFDPADTFLPPPLPYNTDKPGIAATVRDNFTQNPHMAIGRQPALKERKSGNWAVAVFADGNFSNNSGNVISGNALLADRFALTSVNMSSPSSPVVESTNYKHNIPISTGIMARKSLSDKWGIETGLSYTYLYSKAELDNYINYTIKQSAHYIGIPLAVTYSIFRRGNFELYAKAGGEINLNVNTRLKHDFSQNTVIRPYTESYNAKGVLWSVSANAGAMYKITPVFGIYFEPGYSYFFTNDKHPETYWQEHPDNFNMRIGFRTNF